jgi:HK97 family phage major capsid protein
VSDGVPLSDKNFKAKKKETAMLSKQAILEVSELQSKAETLSRGSASERAQATVLVQRIKTIREVGLSSDEVRKLYSEALSESITPSKPKDEYRTKFDNYLAGPVTGIPHRGGMSRLERELRDFLAGTQSITYTQGVAGGYTVPMEYDASLRQAMAQVDPILDDDVTSFEMNDGPLFRPTRVSGYDLSSISAAVIGEATQQTVQGIPSVAGAQLRSDIIFKASFAATMEAEDDIPGFGQKIVRASSVSLARKIGQSVVQGNGGTDISGFLKNLPTSATNATPGKVVNTDITALFFKVNKWYRDSEKAGWLLSDPAYQLVRNATDNQGRPLLDFQDEKETLLGKPIYICPSLVNSAFFSLGVSAVIFGDLASIVIKASKPAIQRVVNIPPSDITAGKSAYIARMKADATLFDPSLGTNPPVAMALWK